MVTPTLKAAVDRLSDAERRDLLHYLAQSVEDDFVLSQDQRTELERRDNDLVSGRTAPLTVDQLMERVRARIQ